MSDVLLLHHALGVTPGVTAFADALRAAGHGVTVPDLFDGQTFTTVEDGVAHAQRVGFDDLRLQGVRAADGLAGGFVPIGISLGVMAAQTLAQTRSDVAAAVLISGCVPPEALGEGGWPPDVAVQVHMKADDPFVVEDGDLAAATALVAGVTDGSLFTYDGDAHLFVDSSTPDYDPSAAGLVVERVLALLDGR